MKKNKEEIFKIFSNEKRVRLILCLVEPKNVTELLSRCDLSQSALSQHLKILRDARVVSCRREGKHQIYHVHNKKVFSIASLLLEL